MAMDVVSGVAPLGHGTKLRSSTPACLGLPSIINASQFELPKQQLVFKDTVAGTKVPKLRLLELSLD